MKTWHKKGRDIFSCVAKDDRALGSLGLPYINTTGSGELKYLSEESVIPLKVMVSSEKSAVFAWGGSWGRDGGFTD